MPVKSMGDLSLKSKSFTDFALAQRDWMLGEVTGEILDHALGGVPDDVLEMLKDQGKFCAVWFEAMFWSTSAGKNFRISPQAKKLAQLAQKIPTLERVLKLRAGTGFHEPVRRLMLVSIANNLDLEQHPAPRIVDPNLTPYEAKTKCLWVGTLAEFRTGSIMTGPADPLGHFAIYLPYQRRTLQGNMAVTRVSCEHQTQLA